MQGQPGYGQQPVAYSQQPMGMPGQMPTMMPMGGGMMPGAVVMHAPKKTGVQLLEELDNIIVKQKPQYMEMFGCEFENKYKVYKWDNEKKGHKIFKCTEKSSFWSRYCLRPDCRPFDMEVHKKKGDEGGRFLHFTREYACTFLCCNRPAIEVKYTEGSKSDFLGKVVAPFTWCDMAMEVYDKDHKLAYLIEGSCCQCGLCFPAPCGPCKEVIFDIKDPRRGDSKPVGQIRKVFSGCMKQCLTDADNFIAYFPAHANWEEKALILAAVIMIDMRYFEDKDDRQDGAVTI